MGNFEATYVDPIPVLVYQNVDESTNAETRHSESDDDQCSYENVSLDGKTISHDSDGSDYQNTEFLDQMKMGSGDDEPVYVNKTA